jgi:hypothetical protein
LLKALKTATWQHLIGDRRRLTPSSPGTSTSVILITSLRHTLSIMDTAQKTFELNNNVEVGEHILL